jgi:pimeloyl-ACP methyl ester carboxylesterase
MKYKQTLFSMFTLAAIATIVAAVPPPVPNGWSDGYVYANGIRIHYYRAVPAPGKPVMVMAHGVTDYGLTWTTLTLDLQANYSDPPIATGAPNAGVQDLIEFLRVMKFEKPILVGHSMGAGTVMRLAAEYPDVPRAVIMLDPGLGAPAVRSATPGASQARPAPRPGALVMFGEPEQLVAQNNRSYDELVAQCRKESPKWDVRDCQYWAMSKRLYHGSYNPPAPGSGMPRMNTQEVLGKITAPALILKADAPADVRKANDQAASALRNGRLVHIDGSGHNLHHDQRQRTVQEFISFLKGL